MRSESRRGPALGGSDLTICVEKRQISLVVPITAAAPSVHGLPVAATPIELFELYRSSYWASSDSTRSRQERYIKMGIQATFSRWWQSCLHRSLGLHQLCAPLTAFIFVDFEATLMRSLGTTAAHLIVLHVLTGMRVRRALR